MPNRAPTASSTRIPSGTTSLPMPSPGMTAMRSLLVVFGTVGVTIASSSRSCGPRSEVPFPNSSGDGVEALGLDERKQLQRGARRFLFATLPFANQLGFDVEMTREHSLANAFAFPNPLDLRGGKSTDPGQARLVEFAHCFLVQQTDVVGILHGLVHRRGDFALVLFRHRRSPSMRRHPPPSPGLLEKG